MLLLSSVPAPFFRALKKDLDAACPGGYVAPTKLIRRTQEPINACSRRKPRIRSATLGNVYGAR
jgi:hypothetical protein